MNQTQQTYYHETGLSSQGILSNVMAKVYLYMFLGLIVTGVTSLAVSSIENFEMFIAQNISYLYILMIVEVALVLIVSLAINKLSYAAALFLFMLYSLVNGMTLSVIFLVYTNYSIYSVFFITAGTFGIMSAIGYTTKKDLTKIGSLCLMGLLGIILAGIVNIFLRSGIMGFLLSVVGVVIFVGLTAYDTQRIKNRLMTMNDPEMIRKASVLGALTLYLDFINIFLKLLRILGKRK